MNLGTLWTTEVTETDFTATGEWGVPGSHGSTSSARLKVSTGWSGAGPATYHQAGAAPGPRVEEAAWLLDLPEGAWSAGLGAGPSADAASAYDTDPRFHTRLQPRKVVVMTGMGSCYKTRRCFISMERSGHRKLASGSLALFLHLQGVI